MTKQKQEWEERFDNTFGLSEIDSDGDEHSVWGKPRAGCDDCHHNRELRKQHKEFISQEIETAYQKGKEEGQTQKLNDKLKLKFNEEFNKTYKNVADRTRLQTIEEVEKVIREGIETTRPVPCPDGNPGCCVYHCEKIRRDLTKDELLQQLNKMKKYEKTN